jgi:hypothetical protein
MVLGICWGGRREKRGWGKKIEGKGKRKPAERGGGNKNSPLRLDNQLCFGSCNFACMGKVGCPIEGEIFYFSYHSILFSSPSFPIFSSPNPSLFPQTKKKFKKKKFKKKKKNSIFFSKSSKLSNFFQFFTRVWGKREDGGRKFRGRGNGK